MVTEVTSSLTKRLAVLIDGENASPSMIGALMTEIARYGTAHARRIYGDWTNPQLKPWKIKLHEFAIMPCQQFSYTTGKNSSDGAMIIDAMDLLYSRNYDGFCLVSSDSDFTKLACWIRESGLVVYGFGEQKTPQAFVKACDKFVYTEILTSQVVEADQPTNTNKSTQNGQQSKPVEAKALAPHRQPSGDKDLEKLLTAAYEAVSEEENWADLSAVGSQLSKLSPDFDYRLWGCKKLSELVRAIQRFEVRSTKEEKVL